MIIFNVLPIFRKIEMLSTTAIKGTTIKNDNNRVLRLLFNDR